MEGGYRQDAALGSQLAAEYVMGLPDNVLYTMPRQQLICQYLTQARDLYLQWGARALVRHLERKHSAYLFPTTMLEDESSSIISVLGNEEATSSLFLRT